MNELAERLYDEYLNEWDMQRFAFGELPDHKQEAWRRVAKLVEAMNNA